uniref:Uncharacterized protein n=1 Tax=Hyaloperonospora arabidopsidis (strain Emoy2) TaxID=559515 RepID=M4B2T3_HYAAE
MGINAVSFSVSWNIETCRELLVTAVNVKNANLIETVDSLARTMDSSYESEFLGTFLDLINHSSAHAVLDTLASKKRNESAYDCVRVKAAPGCGFKRSTESSFVSQ